MINIICEKTDPSAIIPTQATPGSVGFDLYALEQKTLGLGQTVKIRTGVRFEIPEGYFMYVSSKSGLAAKHNMFVVNSPGLIDNDYRGEIIVIMHRLGYDPQTHFSFNTPIGQYQNHLYTIDVGDKIAQLVILQYPQMKLVEAKVNVDTIRGEGGFGSTGK